jgi:hypothetical protein
MQARQLGGGDNAGRASGGGEGGEIWQDAPEYKLIRCIPYDILSNVLETFKKQRTRITHSIFGKTLRNTR